VSAKRYTEEFKIEAVKQERAVVCVMCAGAHEVEIEHDGVLYRLRQT